MNQIHPEIKNFADYCFGAGIDVYEIAQEYANNYPLVYGDYLLLGFTVQDIEDRAVNDYEWDISERPDIVISICEYIQAHHDSDQGTTWHEVDRAIKKTFKKASPEVKALARDGRLRTREEIFNCE